MVRLNDLVYSIEKTGNWQLFLLLDEGRLCASAFLNYQERRGACHWRQKNRRLERKRGRKEKELTDGCACLGA
jgi:hypothetical protein